jgi:phosphotriesterase-related protein
MEPTIGLAQRAPHIAQTVLGPVDVGDLGATLVHEHLSSLLPGNWLAGGRTVDRAEVAARALAPARDFGIHTVVDVTPVSTGPGLSRDVRLMQRVAELLDINVIAPSAFYKDPWLPSWAIAAEIDELTAFHVREAREGIDGTDVRAGILGEVGSSLHRITPNEEKCLRAAARAHLETGLPISTHCTLGTMAPEQIALFQEEGVDLARVIIGHMDLATDIDYLLGVLATGVNIAFDTIGKQWFDYVVPDPPERGEGEMVKWTYCRLDETRLATLTRLVERGHGPQIVLSMDLTGSETYLNGETIGEHGYSYLHGSFLPSLEERGVSQEEIARMLVQNPARILATA